MSFEVVLVGSSGLMRLTRVDFFSICDSAPVPFVGVKGGKMAFEIGLVGRSGLMRLTRVDFFSICDSTPVPFVGLKGTKRAFLALTLSGTVLRVPDAENLKIHP